MLKECKKHGLQRYSHNRCVKCAVEAVTRRRQKVKETLVEYAGGKCVCCGYNKYVGAL